MKNNRYDNEEVTSPIKHKNRTFYACSFGFAAYVGATFSLATLQSSINIKNDLGPKSLFICFICGIGGIITAPFVLKRFGAKFSLIAGELIASLYTLANFYPAWYTMYPTAALSGLTSSSFTWSASAVVVHKVATADLGAGNTKKADIATQKYFGIYLGIVALGQIISNGITVLVLSFVNDESFQTPDSFHYSNLSLNTPATEYTTTTNTSIIDISQCGSRDCPGEYVYSSDSSKISVFLPNDMARNVLLGCYLFMQIGAAILHILAMDYIPIDSIQKSTPRENKELSPTRKPLLNKPQDSATSCSALLRPIKISILHLTSLQGILTAPVYLLYGLSISFIWSEFSRSYVSCIVGLSQVGLTSALVDLLSFAVSLMISRCASNFGMFYLFLFGLCYDIALYIVLLLWVPTVSTSYVVYAFASLFGITHAVRRNTQYLTTSALCPDKDVGFTLQNVLGSVGLMLTYSWTTTFCVDVKIYIMIGVVAITTALWMVAYKLHRRQKSSESETP